MLRQIKTIGTPHDRFLDSIAASHGERMRGLVLPRRRRAVVLSESELANKRHSETPSSHLRECYEASTEFTNVRRTSGAPKALAVALSFCRLLGLGCPKQAFAKIATLRVTKTDSPRGESFRLQPPSRAIAHFGLVTNPTPSGGYHPVRGSQRKKLTFS